MNKIKEYSDDIIDKRIVEKCGKVSRNMSSKFEHVVVIIEESKNLSKLSINELRSYLEVHEQRMNMVISTPNLEQPFNSK